MSEFNNVVFSRNHYTPHYSTPYRIERVTIHLKDLDTTATIYPLFNINQAPTNLIRFLSQEYNDEILRGDTLPFFDKLAVEEFQNFWFGQFAAVMCIGDEPELSEDITVNEWAKRCLGSFFIKSAYPGRCSHICTTNFLVNAGIRRRGIGFYMCECFLRWAPTLGYSRCIIDLVFETNIGLKRLLEKCGFHKVGKVNSCAMLKSTKDILINSFIFTKELTIFEEDANTSKHANILTYLLSGQYPENSSKEDRSRLRALAYHYEVLNSKLYLKGKEVVSDVDDQLRIIKQIHGQDHMGINKTTSLISAKYYWSKIKSTVKKVVDECETCRQDSESKTSRKKRQRTNPKDTTATEDINRMQNIPTLSNQRDETEISNVNNSQIDNSRNVHNDLLMQQSDNVLMNYINLSANTPYQPNNNYLAGLGYKEKAPASNPASNSISSSQDFVSLINYYDASQLEANSRNSNGGLEQINESNTKRSKRSLVSFGQVNELNNNISHPRSSETLSTNLQHSENHAFTNRDISHQGAEDDEDEDDDYEYTGEADEGDDDEEDDDEDGDDGIEDTDANATATANADANDVDDQYDRSDNDSREGVDISSDYVSFTNNRLS